MSSLIDTLRQLGIVASKRGPRGPRRSPRKPGGGTGAPAPVAPNRPRDLTGGAAAALEFGD